MCVFAQSTEVFSNLLSLSVACVDFLFEETNLLGVYHTTVCVGSHVKEKSKLA